MNFDQLMENRYSCRSFSEEPLTEAELSELISAANGAPVGSARYMDLHLTVVRDRAVLDKMTEALFVRVEKKKKEMGIHFLYIQYSGAAYCDRLRSQWHFSINGSTVAGPGIFSTGTGSDGCSTG